MDPPAPVTRMRLPAKCPATAATSVRTGRRPSRSLILGSRTPSMRALPVSSSLTDGTTLGISPQLSAWAVRSLIAVPLAPAIAMTSTVAPVLAAASAIRVRSPRTWTPWMRSRRLAGSSSRMATGRYVECGSRFSRWISIEPASPAPNTMTLTVAAAERRVRWRTANSTYLAPSIDSTANMVLPATACRAACCPAMSRGPVSTRKSAITQAAMPTPMTSSRLPR